MSTKTITDFSTKASQSAVDGNNKFSLANNSAKLAVISDVFGSALDAIWTPGVEVWPGYAINGGYSEAGGLLNVYANKAPSAAWVQYGLKTPDIYNDTVATVDLSDLGDANLQLYCMSLVKDSGNFVIIYQYHSKSTTNYVTVRIFQGGVAREWAQTGNLGALSSCQFKITRVGDLLIGYYNIGGGWIGVASGTRAIGADCSLRLGMMSYNVAGEDCDYDNFVSTGAYWTNAVSFNLDCDGANGTLDAGAGATLAFSSFAETLNAALPSGTSVKYAVATADTDGFGDGGYTAWKTAAEMDTYLAGGAADGYRYASFKVQINTDGKATPDIAEVEIEYSAVTPSGGGRVINRGSILVGSALRSPVIIGR